MHTREELPPTETGEAPAAVAEGTTPPPASAGASSSAPNFPFEGRRFDHGGDRHRRPPPPPDILYHGTTSELASRILETGRLQAPGGRRLYLSHDEGQAWRAAHRLRGEPVVLYVDALRARRAGTTFVRNRHNNLWQVSPIPSMHLLNLQPGFGVQLSAGGIPVRRTPSGRFEVALIQVARRSGTTWEVAKGKLEIGETPEASALREVIEETGMTAELRITRFVQQIRYGFLAPGGLPRLKTVYLYLMEVTGECDFKPAAAEGIGQVRWFPLEEGVRAVTHPSLVPAMRRARDMLLGREDSDHDGD